MAPHIKLTRDLSIFLVGLTGIINEIWFQRGPDRPSLLFLLGAMVGLPAFLRMDDKRKEGIE